MVRRLNTITVLGTGSVIDPPAVFHPKASWVATTDVKRNHLSRIDCESGVVEDLGALEFHPVAAEFNETGETLVLIGVERLLVWSVRGNDAPLIQFQTHFEAQCPLDGSDQTYWADTQSLWVFFEKEWSLWSLADGTRLRSVAPPANERLLRIGKNSSGDTIAVLYDEAPTNHDSVTVSTLNLMTGKAEARIELHDWHQVLVSLDARLAVMQGAQPLSVASVWDLCTGRHIRDIDGIDLGTHPHFASDNRHIVTELVDNSNETWKWLAVTDVESQARYIIDPGAPYRPAIACSPYAPRLVTIANDRRHPVDATRVWDVESGTLVGETTGHVGLARHVFSPCGRWLASVSNAAGGEMAVKSLPSGSVIITGL